MSANNNKATAEATALPEWITAELFEELLKEIQPNFKKISNFKITPAVAAGENYATLMLRIEIEAELLDDQLKCYSYVLKVPRENPMVKELSKKHNIFHIEAELYRDIVPDFEQLYKAVGVELTFGAKFYKLKTDNDHILLEDLRPRNFENVNRLEGLDMAHTKAALCKLAQWHAASAVRYETKGKYNEKLCHAFFTEIHRPMLEQMKNGKLKTFLPCVKTYKNNEVYFESLQKLVDKSIDLLYETVHRNSTDFCVLNHGDCWSNNIMFQHDAFGNIKDTYFVDYQIPCYGSPAQDLLYLLISSTKLEIKLKQFDYFIKYYHDNLADNLRLLGYTKQIPTLRDIHIALYKNDIWGYWTATGVMAPILLDPNEKANAANFVSDSDAARELKLLMYTNQRFRQHIEVILPWLYNRGAMEC